MVMHVHATVEDLPMEVQEDIVGLLPLKDVVHLEQTCQHFHHLITNSSTIWKRRLARECVENKLFASSFDHLTAGAALRDACISGPRLHWACLKTPREGNTLLPHSIIGLKIPTPDHRTRDTGSYLREGELFVHDTIRHPIENAEMRPVKDVVLIPGGRYLLAMYTHELSMWDISSAPTPRLCFQEDLSGSGEASFPRALDVWVEDNVILVKVLLETPSSPVSEKLNTARFFEVSMPDLSASRPSATTFRVHDIGCVAWAGNHDPPEVNATRERVLFKFSGERSSSLRVLLVWYPRRKIIATLVPDLSVEFEHPTEIIFADDYWMVANTQGIWGFGLVPFKPLPDCISIAEYSPQMAVQASFFLPCPITLDSPPTSPIQGHLDPQPSTVPSPEDLSSGASRTFRYQHRFIYDDRRGSGVIHIAYRNALLFNQTNPAKSHILMDEALVIEVTDHQEPQPSYPNTRSCDGGRVEGGMWVMPRTPYTRENDNKAHYMSLAMTRWWTDAELDVPEVEPEDGMAPFMTRGYWREESPSALLTSSFCPASATAVVVWGDGTEHSRTWFDVYRF
ncbi:hypothetical protein FA13DRAFT_1819977 [Coprinellus micaceus]|uniref:F-box domain-containing protein n=1 Tax=Coprinellus micaceus TaxID=71717 RepID=A0A4Y7SHT0_COPMI|nr:hypothetical protein FA13DRAFT_1819977 [Coprinellus micaceus]